MHGVLKALFSAVLFIGTVGSVLAADLVDPQNETIVFRHVDVLGSPVATTDDQGRVLWYENTSAFGESLGRRATGGHGFGDNAAPNPDVQVGYTGHSRDTASGLTYMKARYYDPKIGRFYSNDPVGFTIDNPMMFNRYAYANNNPYVFVDPDGRWAEDIFAGIPSVGVGMYSFASNMLSGNWKDAGIDAAGVIADAVAIAVPGVPGIAGLGIKASRLADVTKAAEKATDVTKGAGKADKAPDFLVSPSGTAFPVPKGATGPTPVVNPAGRKTGDAFTGGSGGANGQVDTMRMMDPTPPRGNSPGYANGYIKYENKAGQGVDPYTGRTLSNRDSHFPSN